MRKLIFLFVRFFVLVLAAGAQARGFDHSPWDHVLKKFVTEKSRVNYAALKADSTELDRYVEQLAARSPVSHPKDFPTRDSQIAYWVNACNSLVVKGVIGHWPAENVRDIGKLPYSFFGIRDSPPTASSTR